VGRTISPLGDRVVVKPSDQEEVSSGGILLPDTAKERPQEGKVIAAGPGRVTDEGKTIPMEIQVGDLVVYSRYAGTEWKDTDNEEVLIMRESDVLGKIS
jgi:chaperonin GroES